MSSSSVTGPALIRPRRAHGGLSDQLSDDGRTRAGKCADAPGLRRATDRPYTRVSGLVGKQVARAHAPWHQFDPSTCNIVGHVVQAIPQSAAPIGTAVLVHGLWGNPD